MPTSSFSRLRSRRRSAARVLPMLLLPWALALAPAWAAPGTAQRMTVSATVLSHCTLHPNAVGLEGAAIDLNLRCNTPVLPRVRADALAATMPIRDLSQGNAQARAHAELIRPDATVPEPAGGRDSYIQYTIEY